MKTIFINGRFLGKPITGVERFAREVLSAMDALLAQDEAAPEVVILSPAGTPPPENLQKIKFKTCGTLSGHAWEQWDLWRAARGGVLVSPCNCGPVLHSDHLVVIHDALVYRVPQDFLPSYRLLHQMLGHILARRARLATVSDFSRHELSSLLKIQSEDIVLVPNGHEHMLRHAPDEIVLEKLKLNGRQFLLFIGSPAPRKNLLRAIDAFIKLGQQNVALVIVGAGNAKVFTQSEREMPENVIRPGRLSDQEIVALYRHAHALVFPSLYEGFGIPPLEAMVHGCPVIAADIPPVREVCGDAVAYFNPHDTDSLTEAMRAILAPSTLRQELITKGGRRFSLFSWKSSATGLLEALRQ